MTYNITYYCSCLSPTALVPALDKLSESTSPIFFLPYLLARSLSSAVRIDLNRQTYLFRVRTSLGTAAVNAVKADSKNVKKYPCSYPKFGPRSDNCRLPKFPRLIAAVRSLLPSFVSQRLRQHTGLCRAHCRGQWPARMSLPSRGRFPASLLIQAQLQNLSPSDRTAVQCRPGQDTYGSNAWLHETCPMTEA